MRRFKPKQQAQRSALVTGAASGIGQATAEAFIRKGYATLLVDRDTNQGRQVEEELKSIGECKFLTCNVADDADVAAMFEKALAVYGRLDVAFNAAGVNGSMAPLTDCSIENWDLVMSVNLRGLWLCLKHEIRQMLKQPEGGAIVNCASSAGLVGVAGLAAYVASKHGVVGLTRSAALENARNNIRVNAVCPGMIDTPMWQSSITQEMTAELLANDPSGRLGQPEEIAEAVIWLCDPAASFVNGQALAVDGGMTVK